LGGVNLGVATAKHIQNSTLRTGRSLVGEAS